MFYVKLRYKLVNAVKHCIELKLLMISILLLLKNYKVYAHFNRYSIMYSNFIINLFNVVKF